MKPLESLRVMGRVVAYHPKIAKHVGGVNAAILLCQLIYWDDRAADQELGIYKTSEEWEEETGLSYREQATARTKLRDLGLLTETSKRLQHRIYYKVNYDVFNELRTRIPTSSNSKPSRLPADEWKALRKRVFERDGFCCTYCGQSGGRLECDHIHPLSKGGSNDEDNLTTACNTCNRSKGTLSVQEWRVS